MQHFTESGNLLRKDIVSVLGDYELFVQGKINTLISGRSVFSFIAFGFLGNSYFGNVNLRILMADNLWALREMHW